MSEGESELDLEAQHLRPAPHGEAPAEVAEQGPEPPALIDWETDREQGLAVALVRTIWSFAGAPRTAFAATPARGGPGAPWSYALTVGAVLGTLSELIDFLMVALLHFAGAGTDVSQLFQFSIAGRSLEWLPVSVLSVTGCMMGLLLGIPAFLLLYSVVLFGWSCVVHLCLGLSGSLRRSDAGFQGTLRAVLYAQTGLLAAPIPLVGDLAALAWSGALQVVGLERMHGCGRARAASAVLLPGVLLLVPLIWLLWTRALGVG